MKAYLIQRLLYYDTPTAFDESEWNFRAYRPATALRT